MGAARRAFFPLLLAGCLAGRGGAGGTPAAAGRAASAPTDPAPAPVRRLNRSEYCNTVRDLLGVSQRACAMLPEDAEFQGFDTFADVQTTSPLHAELYERAAEQIVAELRSLPPDDPRRVRAFPCVPTPRSWRACAALALHGLAQRAWRRPVQASEVEPYLAVVGAAVAAEQTPDAAIALGVEALLLSPQFLFHLELDPAPRSAAPHALTDHELASRLSYALWSTMPDDDLRRAADRGALHQPAELAAQVRRMLASPRAAAFVRDFVGQWLLTRRLPGHDVDRRTFKGFDRELRAGLQEETERFFHAFVLEERPIKELLTADFTFVNDRVAKHYGLPDGGPEFQRASLAATARRGLLTQASVLTVTSFPERTSPVKRGIWVLEQLLCEEILPPPMDVQPLEAQLEGVVDKDERDAIRNRTLRERLEDHRADVSCAACHKIIDPIGFGLESFDAVGVQRTEDNGHPIDSEGKLPDGRHFSGPVELATLLANDDRFERCFTDRLLTYVLGRSFKDREGKAWVAHIAAQAHAQGGSVAELLAALVTEVPFRMRRGEAVP
jgi:hypothetical protein